MEAASKLLRHLPLEEMLKVPRTRSRAATHWRRACVCNWAGADAAACVPPHTTPSSFTPQPRSRPCPSCHASRCTSGKVHERRRVRCEAVDAIARSVQLSRRGCTAGQRPRAPSRAPSSRSRFRSSVSVPWFRSRPRLGMVPSALNDGSEPWALALSVPTFFCFTFSTFSSDALSLRRGHRSLLYAMKENKIEVDRTK